MTQAFRLPVSRSSWQTHDVAQENTKDTHDPGCEAGHPLLALGQEGVGLGWGFGGVVGLRFGLGFGLGLGLGPGLRYWLYAQTFLMAVYT